VVVLAECRADLGWYQLLLPLVVKRSVGAIDDAIPRRL
jgi:hypothetical protein